MWSTADEIDASQPGCPFLSAIAQSVLRIWLLVSQNCAMRLLCATLANLRCTCTQLATPSSLRGNCPLLANSSGLRGNCPLLANSPSLRGNYPLFANSSSISTEAMDFSGRAIARLFCNATCCLLPNGLQIGFAVNSFSATGPLLHAFNHGQSGLGAPSVAQQRVSRRNILPLGSAGSIWPVPKT